MLIVRVTLRFVMLSRLTSTLNIAFPINIVKVKTKKTGHKEISGNF